MFLLWCQDITKAELKSRTFKFSKFYSQLSDDVKPVGVQFFQCEWDKTVRQALLHTLGELAWLPMYEIYPDCGYVG